jgi:hypothetical protein
MQRVLNPNRASSKALREKRINDIHKKASVKWSNLGGAFSQANI